jgi:hypothetical protein
MRDVGLTNGQWVGGLAAFAVAGIVVVTLLVVAIVGLYRVVKPAILDAARRRKGWRNQVERVIQEEGERHGDDKGDDFELEWIEVPREFTLADKVDQGLFRIWLVLTMFWWAFWLFVGDQKAMQSAIWPPAVVLTVGLMLRWAIRGFLE